MAYKFPATKRQLSAIAAGESTIHRLDINSSVASATGVMRLAHFEAEKTETITSLASLVGGTSSSGATLCRFGVYSEDASGNLTLIKSTTNDTALWSTINSVGTKALSASWAKEQGKRYAIGMLCVGASPVFHGYVAGLGVKLGSAPRLCSFVTGQTDLPSSILVGSLFDTTTIYYVEMVPA